MGEKNRINMVINERMYTVVSEESPEYMTRLADHINEKVSIVRKAGVNIMGERPIILAALNICDEYFKALSGGDVSNNKMSELEAKMEEIIEENKQLRNLLNESQFELDIQAMQAKYAEVMKRNEELSAALDNQKTMFENEIKTMLEDHRHEIENIKQGFIKREQEVLEAAGLSQ